MPTPAPNESADPRPGLTGGPSLPQRVNTGCRDPQGMGLKIQHDVGGAVLEKPRFPTRLPSAGHPDPLAVPQHFEQWLLCWDGLWGLRHPQSGKDEEKG
jgi:hypothetical protein